MKTLLLLFLTMFITDLDKISKINSVKAEAKEAYQKGDFQTAISKYRYLRDSLGVTEDEVLMNLGNAYFQTNDTTNAVNTFRTLAEAKQPNLRSVANQQLGVLSNRKGQYEEALNYFKQSLKANPANEEARFNYEMVKKKLEEEKKKQEQDKQNKDKQEDKKDQQKDQQDQKNKEQQEKEKQEQEKKEKEEQQKKDQKDKQEQKDKDQQSKEEKEKQEKEKQEQEQKEKESKEKDKLPPSVSEKLKQMEMSEEKAKMILEAMKNQEVQYLQQNKRKATKPRDKGKPDW